MYVVGSRGALLPAIFAYGTTSLLVPPRPAGKGAFSDLPNTPVRGDVVTREANQPLSETQHETGGLAPKVRFEQ